jgi:hypothetical protein
VFLSPFCTALKKKCKAGKFGVFVCFLFAVLEFELSVWEALARWVLYHSSHTSSLSWEIHNEQKLIGSYFWKREVQCQGAGSW